MYNVIKVGEKEVPMLAMASTDLYYKRIFREDAIKMQAKEMDEGDLINFVMKVGFVMAKQAEKADMKTLNEDSFIEWMDGFDRTDYINSLPDIRLTYEGQKVPSSDEKKSPVE